MAADAVVAAVGEIAVGSQSPWELGSCRTAAALVAVLQRQSFQIFCTGNRMGEFTFLKRNLQSALNFLYCSKLQRRNFESKKNLLIQDIYEQ